MKLINDLRTLSTPASRPAVPSASGTLAGLGLTLRPNPETATIELFAPSGARIGHRIFLDGATEARVRTALVAMGEPAKGRLLFLRPTHLPGELGERFDATLKAVEQHAKRGSDFAARFDYVLVTTDAGRVVGHIAHAATGELLVMDAPQKQTRA